MLQHWYLKKVSTNSWCNAQTWIFMPTLKKKSLWNSAFVHSSDSYEMKTLYWNWSIIKNINQIRVINTDRTFLLHMKIICWPWLYSLCKSLHQSMSTIVIIFIVTGTQSSITYSYFNFSLKVKSIFWNITIKYCIVQYNLITQIYYNSISGSISERTRK